MPRLHRLCGAAARGTVAAASVLAGFACILAGLVMLVVPGPGLLAIAAGLALLGRHYAWARQLRAVVQRRALAAAQSARRRLNRDM